MTATLHITAKRWEHGWELHLGEECITQCSTLDRAEQQVRDYMCTMHDLDSYDGPIIVTPDIGPRALVEAMRREQAAAAAHAAEAARARDTIIREMHEAGFGYNDIAGAVGVSKARVGQLINA